MSKAESTPALVCIVGAIAPDERSAHSARIRRLFGEVALERIPEASGYTFHFDATELEELARFIAQERKCCPLLSFSIEVRAEDGPVRLRIGGPPGSRELVEAELLRPAFPNS